MARNSAHTFKFVEATVIVYGLFALMIGIIVTESFADSRRPITTRSGSTRPQNPIVANMTFGARHKGVSNNVLLQSSVDWTENNDFDENIYR